MRTKTYPIAAVMAILAALLHSCETYEQVPENSPFAIEALVSASRAGDPVQVVLQVTEGNHEGDCTLEAVLRDASGASPDFRVLLGGNATIGPASAWQFNGDGLARFALEGVPAGTYSADFTVRRWYHSATASTVFTVKK